MGSSPAPYVGVCGMHRAVYRAVTIPGRVAHARGGRSHAATPLTLLRACAVGSRSASHSAAVEAIVRRR